MPEFSQYRQKIADQLVPLLDRTQAELDAAGETKVNAHDLLLETVIKMALITLDRSKLAFVLSRYSKIVADETLTGSMNDDQMPDPE